MTVQERVQTPKAMDKQAPGSDEHVLVAILEPTRVAEAQGGGIPVQAASARQGVVARKELEAAPACRHAFSLTVAPRALPVRLGREPRGDVVKGRLGDTGGKGSLWERCRRPGPFLPKIRHKFPPFSPRMHQDFKCVRTFQASTCCHHPGCPKRNPGPPFPRRPPPPPARAAPAPPDVPQLFLKVPSFLLHGFR